jgi:hypothetical protein
MADTPIQSTGEIPQSKARSQIIDEAKRLEETTLYSSKVTLPPSFIQR